MSPSRVSSPNLRLRITKMAARLACVFFIIAVVLSPGPGSSLGMPWPLFYSTWGVMLFASVISLFGFICCKLGGDRIGVFYAICPSLLIITLMVFLNLYDIVRGILRYEGAV
jgi:hypothetical protein